MAILIIVILLLLLLLQERLSLQTKLSAMEGQLLTVKGDVALLLKGREQQEHTLGEAR